MRHGGILAGLAGAAVVAPLVAGLEPAPVRLAAGAAATLVTYRGVQVPVPAGWEVVRLDRDPGRCVRLDRHAIYVGAPGPQPDCPARVVGRTETLHVEPSETGSMRRRAAVRTAVHAARLARYTVRENAERQVRLRLPEVGVKITGTYGAAPDALQRTIRSVRLTSTWSAAGPGDPRKRKPASRTPRTHVPHMNSERRGRTGAVGSDRRGWAVGRGFDTCTAPSVRTMAAWRRAYRIANIYIGGVSRGCAQPNLTRSWVRRVRGMGYRLIPTYVGLQAPCTRYSTRFTVKNAAAKGSQAAVYAARRARALGIPRRKPIYYDIEAYDSGKKRCRKAVLTFLHSWTRKLKARGYAPGVYSSVGSGIRDLGRATGISKPRAIWYAHWDGKASVYGNPYLPSHWWPPHRRIKQYRGDHRERHGGVTLNIDSNIVDGRVY